MSSTKPRIAIPEPHSSRQYTGKRLQDYVAPIEAAGGEAVIIELALPSAEQAHRMKSCDAVLLPGSPADLDPEKYGEVKDPHTAAADVARDNADELLLQDAYNMRKPVFGICYGVQSLNVWRTGSLVQHIESKIAHEVKHEARAHTVEVKPATMLAKIAAEAEPNVAEHWVNSSHHQSLATLGDGLQLAATSPHDGVVEAVEGTAPDQWVLGVQWHPERTYKEDKFSRLLFERFLAEARRWHEQFAAKKNDFEAVR
ncbi:peptidase C26 [Candidatus Koribacter versatilis Ellin345]|uniref:Peptidase C26 n=1 Tax=Koribacter versatilis (strain Ellin345) TaxID=204669 RepID=Q1IVH4_KORVE|nr:gamma-glutamyl-gamma-aminobutyrate hydrolase family protein [Candidatus Koribacter versatilis]ABF39126.1 peptidase C26 [Candidatus Koribacter versatilis Ellin345]